LRKFILFVGIVGGGINLQGICWQNCPRKKATAADKRRSCEDDGI